MDDILPKLNFNHELVAEFEQRTKDVIRFHLSEEAKIFVDILWPQVITDKSLIKNQPDIFNRLQRIYALNTILLMSRLSNDKLVELFKEQIQLYFQEMIDDVDIWYLLRGKLVSISDPRERDSLKELLRQALVNNQNVITSQKIIRNDKSYEPAIAAWIIDYTSFAGVGKVNAVKLNEYFTESKNFQKLSAKEQYIVRQLISFYERLKKSSLEPEGLEERPIIYEDGRLLVFREGRFESIDQRIFDLLKKIEDQASLQGSSEQIQAIESESISADQQEILAAYQGDIRQVQAIGKLTQKIEKKFGGNTGRLRAEFFAAVQKKDVQRTIALLRLLSKKDDLGKFLAEDEKLNKFLVVTWEKQFGKNFSQAFQKNPVQPEFVRQFLRYVLEQRLEMKSSDAARVGLQVANIFVDLGKKRYNKMAYFDVASKSFKWFE